MNGVTRIDLNMIDYFINERGDITRWSQWEERRPVIAVQFPELIDALERVKIAERTLRAVVKQVLEHECSEPTRPMEEK